MSNCEFPSCTNLEPLPFRCKYCDKSFCRIHRLPENHNCDKKNIGISPLAERKEKYERSESTPSDTIYVEKQAKKPKRSNKVKKSFFKNRKKEKKEKIYETYYDSEDAPFYTTDPMGNIFVTKPTEQRFRDKAFFSLLGDHLTVGKEFFDFILGLLVLALSWSLVSKFIFGFEKWYFIPIMMVLVILVYCNHILTQKWLAKRNGLQSRYVLSKIGLILTIITAISPFRILSPGYLIIPEINFLKPKQKGIISLVPLLFNLSLGTCCLFLGTFLQISNQEILLLCMNGAILTSTLVFFSILPFTFALGKRILDWNKWLYYSLFTYCIGLLISSLILTFFF